MVVVLAMAAVAAFLPAGEVSRTGEVPTQTAAPIGVCPIFESGNRTTTINVLSAVDGPVRVSGFAAGSELESVESSIGPTGAFSLAGERLGAVGVTGGLIEYPTEQTAASIVVSGGSGFAITDCYGVPTTTSVLSGGSTTGDSKVQVLLLNPYAGEAIVDLTVTSENGIESDSSLSGIVVPALSSLAVDLDETLPERQTIDVLIEGRQGFIIAYGVYRHGEDVSVMKAVEPSNDWWFVIPPNQQARLSAFSPSGGAVDYQIDLYDPEGLVPIFAEGVFEGRATDLIDLSELSSTPIALRLNTTVPVAVSLRVASQGEAVAQGHPALATTWLLPGAGGPVGGSGQLLILNGGADPVSVDIHSIGSTTSVRSLEIQPDQILSEPMAAVTAHRIEASGPVVVFWTGQTPQGFGLGSGTPFEDG